MENPTTPGDGAARELAPSDRENDDAKDVDVVAGSGGYRFPPRNPHAGAAIALLRPQFGRGVR